MLFGGGHQRASWDILKIIKELTYEDKIQRQLLLMAATLPRKTPKSVGVLLKQGLPRDTAFVDTEVTHHVVASTDVKFVRVVEEGGEESKTEQLIEELVSLSKPEGNAPKILVFCNTVTSVTTLYDKLTDSTFWWHGKIGQLHKHVTPDQRVAIVHKYNIGDVKILLSTDLSSRGLDLTDINTVIMYDFPSSTVDFLHRAGRTARAGKSGKG